MSDKPRGKKCGRCKEWKEPIEDHFKPHRRDGWQSYCTKCSSDWAKERYREKRQERLTYQRAYNKRKRAKK